MQAKRLRFRPQSTRTKSITKQRFLSVKFSYLLEGILGKIFVSKVS